MRRTTSSLALLLAACATNRASTWTGAGDGASWTDPANWSGNAPPSADDNTWDIGAGWSVQLNGPAPGDRIVKLGEGTLRWSDGASAETVEVRQGTFELPGRTRGPSVQLTGGHVVGDFMQSPIEATGGSIGGYIWAPLTLTGGAVTFDDASAGYGVAMHDAAIRGHLLAESVLWLAPGDATSRIEGHVELFGGSSLCWSMQDSVVVAPLVVTGQLSSIYSEMWIYFGLVDWSQPHWQTQRDYLFVDAQEGGSITANLVADPYAGNEGWGTWSRVPAADGDIVMRWTPLANAAYGVAAIPESSAAPWILALAGLLVAWRTAGPRAGHARL